MRLFGSIAELVSTLYRKDNQAITLQPNSTTTYTASRTVELPQTDTAETILGRVSLDQGAARVKNKDLEDSTVAIVDESDATKKLKFQVSGITTGTTRTLSVPDVSDTILTTAATQNVTNKNITVADNAFTIQDNGDATKQAVFEASGISTATTRTYALPDASTTLVGRTEVAQVSNKSLVDTSTVIVDSVDTTKQIKFDAGGTTGTSTTLTAAQTADRVITFPDATTTVVGTDVSQILSSKTLASPDVTTHLRLLNQGQLKLRETTGGGTEEISLQAPSTLSSSYTLTLPTVVASTGQVLSAADNAGTLTWSAPFTNPMDSEGDMVIGGVGGASTKLDHPGAANYHLRTNSSTDTSWSLNPNFLLGTKTSQASGGTSLTLSAENQMLAYYTISSGDTFTLQSDSFLGCAEQLTVSGDLIVTDGVVSIF